MQQRPSTVTTGIGLRSSVEKIGLTAHLTKSGGTMGVRAHEETTKEQGNLAPVTERSENDTNSSSAKEKERF